MIAAVNEEEGIGPTLRDLRKYLSGSNFLVVDGFSKDKTAKIATRLGTQVICRECNGKVDALAYAINNITGDYDYVVFIDADYTYPAEFLPLMIKTMQEKQAVGMVCGNRFNSNYPTI